MYSLKQHRQFYNNNHIALEKSKNIVNNSKDVHVKLLQSVQQGKLRPDQERILQTRIARKNKHLSQKEFRYSMPHKEEEQTIVQDKDVCESKDWELLKYRGKRIKPSMMLSITKREEMKHGKNILCWTDVLKKNNNIDYDAKKSFENLKKRIDLSQQTVGKIKHGGASLFDRSGDASIMSNISSIHQTINVPILDNDEYRDYIAEIVKTYAPGNSLDSTVKRWYQIDKNQNLDINAKDLHKKLNFPTNPAFFPQGDFKKKKLQSVIHYCKDNRIAMNSEQQITKNILNSKNMHDKFSLEVNDIYKGKSQGDGEYLIDKLRNSFEDKITDELKFKITNKSTSKSFIRYSQSRTNSNILDYNSKEQGNKEQLLRLSQYLTNPTTQENKRYKSKFKNSKQKKGDGTFQILKTTIETQNNKNKLSQKLNDILTRVELDRPILFREKLDVIWNANIMKSESPQKNKSIEQSRNIRRALDNKKKDRLIKNQDQRKVYRKLLGYFRSRHQHPLEEEVQLLNIFKIIIDGGWIITEGELKKLLSVLNIPTQSNNSQFAGFLTTCIQELKLAQIIFH